MHYVSAQSTKEGIREVLEAARLMIGCVDWVHAGVPFIYYYLFSFVAEGVFASRAEVVRF